MLNIASLNIEFPECERVEFNSVISLTDFDVIIIDPNHVVSSFGKAERRADNQYEIVGQRAMSIITTMERRQSEIHTILNNGKIIVSFLTPPHERRLVDERYSTNQLLHGYSWFAPNNPLFFNLLVNGTGKRLKLIDNNHPFAAYYHAFRKELTFTSYISLTPDKFLFGEAFIVNETNYVVGFSVNVLEGLVVFIPEFPKNEENNKKFIGVILDIAKKHFEGKTKPAPPDWANKFIVPGMGVLDLNIKDLDEKITDLENKRGDVEIRRNSLDDYKLLLYGKGNALKDKVVEAMKLIGFKAETTILKNTDLDIVLEADGRRAIAEVEGRDDHAIDKDKVDQLLSAISQDGVTTGDFAKGVLVGNHYCLNEPAERKDPFTSTAINLAKLHHYALLKTMDLFDVVVYLLVHPENDEFKKACRDALINADGVLVKFPIPVQTKPPNSSE